MEFDVGVYSLIYEYYEARILCGYYRFDDRLPSIPRISAFFQVAPATVRSALSLLEEKGYVAVNAKKAARVTYRPDPARYRENAALYFVPRESGLADMTQGGRLILEPCWEAGLLQWGKSSWQELLLRLDTDRPGFLSMRIAFYILALSALDNRLILNLYWEIIRYLRFPLLIERPVVDVESARGGQTRRTSLPKSTRSLSIPTRRLPPSCSPLSKRRAKSIRWKTRRRFPSGGTSTGSGPKCVTRWRPA